MPVAKEPKYRVIFDHVYQGILRGKYRPGARIPTEMELAQQFAASRMTVSRALRDLTNQGLLYRRQGSGTFVRANDPASTHSIGLLLLDFPWFQNGVFDAMTMEITVWAQTAGYRLVFHHPASLGLDVVLNQPEKICELYLKQEVAGVIFGPAELSGDQIGANGRIVEILERAGIPVILVDRDTCDFPSRSRHDLVGVDNVGASYMLTEHLVKLGHRRVHYVALPTIAATVTARIMGYKMALLDHGIVPEESWVHRGDVSSLDFVRSVLEQSSADAFVCPNDHLAAMLMRHLSSMGIRVPKEVAVVGFDDAAIASLLAPPLTTARQPSAHLGSVAVRTMLERLERPKGPPCEIRLACELVVRESCGAISSPVGDSLVSRKRLLGSRSSSSERVKR